MGLFYLDNSIFFRNLQKWKSWFLHRFMDISSIGFIISFVARRNMGGRCSANVPQTKKVPRFRKTFAEHLWAQRVMIPRPSDYESAALTNWAMGPYKIATIFYYFFLLCYFSLQIHHSGFAPLRLWVRCSDQLSYGPGLSVRDSRVQK